MARLEAGGELNESRKGIAFSSKFLFQPNEVQGAGDFGEQQADHVLNIGLIPTGSGGSLRIK